jgi:hypothetical protein
MIFILFHNNFRQKSNSWTRFASRSDTRCPTQCGSQLKGPGVFKGKHLPFPHLLLPRFPDFRERKKLHPDSGRPPPPPGAAPRRPGECRRVVHMVGKILKRGTTFPSTPFSDSDFKPTKNGPKVPKTLRFKLRSSALGAVSGETEHIPGLPSSPRTTHDHPPPLFRPTTAAPPPASIFCFVFRPRNPQGRRLRPVPLLLSIAGALPGGYGTGVSDGSRFRPADMILAMMVVGGRRWCRWWWQISATVGFLR